MRRPIRITLATMVVMRALKEHESEEMWGLRICQMCGLHSGTVYPILERLRGVGWATAEWEKGAPPDGRPRRRLYQLTDTGRAAYAEIAKEMKF